MKQSFVKMMNRIAEMENCILKGLVLDEHGNWVSIADRKAVEEDSLAHLSAGQVLFEGRWVSFTEVKTSRTRRIERPPLIGGIVSRKKTIAVETPATPAPAVQPSTLVGTPPGITIIVQSQPPPASAYSSVGAPPAPPIKTPPETVETPPETKVIVQTPPPEEETRTIQKPPPSSEKTAVAAPTTSAPPTPVSAPDMPPPPETAIIVHTPPPSHHEKDQGIEEFAPETKIILIRPPEQSTPSASDTQTLVKPGDTQFFHPPQITPPPPDESGLKLKNLIVIIAGTIVVIATIVAVLLIVVQMAR